MRLCCFMLFLFILLYSITVLTYVHLIPPGLRAIGDLCWRLWYQGTTLCNIVSIAQHYTWKSDPLTGPNSNSYSYSYSLFTLLAPPLALHLTPPLDPHPKFWICYDAPAPHWITLPQTLTLPLPLISVYKSISLCLSHLCFVTAAWLDFLLYGLSLLL